MKDQMRRECAEGMERNGVIVSSVAKSGAAMRMDGIVRELIGKGRRTAIPIGQDAVSSHNVNENDYYIQLT